LHPKKTGGGRSERGHIFDAQATAKDQFHVYYMNIAITVRRKANCVGKKSDQYQVSTDNAEASRTTKPRK
jgi:hypothetical protein